MTVCPRNDRAECPCLLSLSFPMSNHLLSSNLATLSKPFDPSHPPKTITALPFEIAAYFEMLKNHDKKIKTFDLLVMIRIDFKFVPNTKLENLNLVSCCITNSKGRISVTKKSSLSMLVGSFARQIGESFTIPAEITY